MSTFTHVRSRTGRALEKVSYGQYGTFKPGTSQAEKENRATDKPTAPRLSAHPKSGTAPAPMRDALEYVMAGERLERLRASTALELAELRREEREVVKELKKADVRGNWTAVDWLKGRKRDILSQRARLIGKLEEAEQKYAEWGITRANKGFSPTRGYMRGGDIVSGADITHGRSSRGRASAEKINQEKARD